MGDIKGENRGFMALWYWYCGTKNKKTTDILRFSVSYASKLNTGKSLQIYRFRPCCRANALASYRFFRLSLAKILLT